MIYSIAGQVAEKGTDYVVVQCDKIAYYLHTTLNTLASLSSEHKDTVFFTYLHVREDIMELYGFSSKQEKEWFTLLITVSGVGPKAALAILSTLTPDNLTLCILNEDVKSLGTSKGIGPKTAKRIVLELKDKVAKLDLGTSGQNTSLAQGIIGQATNSAQQEAVSALVALGYSQLEAASALKGAESTLSVEELIKHGLKVLARQV